MTTTDWPAIDEAAEHDEALALALEELSPLVTYDRAETMRRFAADFDTIFGERI